MSARRCILSASILLKPKSHSSKIPFRPYSTLRSSSMSVSELVSSACELWFSSLSSSWTPSMSVTYPPYCLLNLLGVGRSVHRLTIVVSQWINSGRDYNFWLKLLHFIAIPDKLGKLSFTGSGIPKTTSLSGFPPSLHGSSLSRGTRRVCGDVLVVVSSIIGGDVYTGADMLTVLCTSLVGPKWWIVVGLGMDWKL